MKRKTQLIIIFISIHIIIISSATVYLAYKAYSGRISRIWYRQRFLSEMYDEIIKYKAEHDQFPKTLEPLWGIDNENQNIYFGSKELPYIFQENFSKSRFAYQLVNGTPVLTDLGWDLKENGLGMNWDVSFPAEYQERFPFRQFIKTKQFMNALLQGLGLGGMISFFLYGIWMKGFSDSIGWFSVVGL